MTLKMQVEKGKHGKSKDPMKNFENVLTNPESLRQYKSRFKYFLDSLYAVHDEVEDTFRVLDSLVNPQDPSFEEQVNDFMKYKNDPEMVKECFLNMIDVQKRRVKAGKVTDNVIMNYYKAAKKFCDANDIITNWGEILGAIPNGRKSSNDRKPTLEEIRKLVSYSDKRIKAVVYTMASSGIRISSWDKLKYSDLEPYYDKDGKVTCAKLRAYNIKKKNINDDDKYYSTFISPEAYYELENWINFRKSHGEIIDKNSWLMRDLFESTKKNGNNVGNVNNPKPLKSTGIKTMLERAAKSAKLFEPLKEGQKRREWKIAHGLRKWFKSRAESENSIKSIYIEMLLDHDIKLDHSYHKPTEIELRDLYLKIVPLVTIEEANLEKNRMEEVIEEKVRKEFESKYEGQNKELRKELVLMKLHNCIMQELVPDKRKEKKLNGVTITAKEQFDCFVEMNVFRKSSQKDIELLKEMLDNGEIEAYEEESEEAIEFENKFYKRWNKYKDKIDFGSRDYESYYFDDNDNLVIELKKELNRPNFILPP